MTSPEESTPVQETGELDDPMTRTWTDWSGSAALAKLDVRCPVCKKNFQGADRCPEHGLLLVPSDEETLDEQYFDNRYLILSLAGRGGMSNVYKAKSLASEEICAIKILRAPLSDTRSVRRFEHEASAIKRLSHPNILSVHEFGVFHGHAFMVMEYLHGRSLAERLKQSGPLGGAEFIDLAMQICTALNHAHKRNVVHRDVKPANVILLEGENKSETVKLVDFGISKILDLKDDTDDSRKASFVGSPAYMSPEQWRSEPIDFKGDIYSLGCLLFECLTGSPPFKGRTTLELLKAHTLEEPQQLPEESAIDSKVSSMISRCLKKSAKDRPSLSLLMGVLSEARATQQVH